MCDVYESSQKDRNVRMCGLWRVCGLHVNWGCMDGWMECRG